MDKVDRFINIFEGFQDRFGFYIEDDKVISPGEKKSGRSITGIDGVRREHWESHLEGKPFYVTILSSNKPKKVLGNSLGIVPINKDNNCKWGCIDLDNREMDHHKLISIIKKFELPLIVCKSKSNGAHAFLFCTDFIPASVMKHKLELLSTLFGEFEVDKIFPQQEEILADRGDSGSWLNMPYAGNTRRAVKLDGTEATLEEFFEMYDQYKQSPEQIENLKLDFESDWFKDGPPCLQFHAKQGVIEGERNDIMLDICKYLKKRFPSDDEKDPEGWKNKAYEYNKKFVGLKETEIANTNIKSADKKNYNYSCKKLHLKKYCNAKLCITRKYGIGENTDVAKLSIGPLAVMKSDPPLWFCTINGKRVILSTKEKNNQLLFRDAVCDQTYKTPASLPKLIFEERMRELEASATDIPVPEDSKTTFKLKNLLEEFCINRQQGDTLEEIEIDKVFFDKEREVYVFKFRVFYDFLEANKWKVNENKTHIFLKDLKTVSYTQVNLTTKENKKKNIRVYEAKIEKKEVEIPNKNFGLDEDL
ncbi:MAG: hypothetical protein VW200_01795 [Pelagibacteraceae bacterium]